MPFLSTKARFTNAFTLIELLVVIAIIAILASILFPVFARARENARRASCQSNLKQIGLGMLQYSQDYDEMMVRSSYGQGSGDGTSSSTKWKWMDATYPYIKSTQVFDCPSKSGDTPNTPYVFCQPGVSPTSGNERKWGSYAINAVNIAGATAPSNNGKDASLAAVQEPSTTFWVGDSEADSNYDYTYRFATNNIDEIKYATATLQSGSYRGVVGAINWSSRLVERHLNTMNALYCDGHVKVTKLDTLIRRTGNTMPMFTVDAD